MKASSILKLVNAYEGRKVVFGKHEGRQYLGTPLGVAVIDGIDISSDNVLTFLGIPQERRNRYQPHEFDVGRILTSNHPRNQCLEAGFEIVLDGVAHVVFFDEEGHYALLQKRYWTGLGLDKLAWSEDNLMRFKLDSQRKRVEAVEVIDEDSGVLGIATVRCFKREDRWIQHLMKMTKFSENAI